MNIGAPVLWAVGLGAWLGLRGFRAPAQSAPAADSATRPASLAPVVAPADTLVQLDLSACPAERAPVGAVLFVGNGVTKERTLRAELDFREGDTLAVAELAARLEANRRRLFNLQLFHAVLAQARCGPGGRLTVVFSVQERWYILPTPIFSLAERNFNAWLNRTDRWRRVDYGLHLTHANFRGRNEQLTLNVQHGFNRKYEAFYEAPGFGRRRRLGLGLGVSYYQSPTLDYNTEGDRLVSVRLEEGFPIQRFYVGAGLRLRQTVQFVSALDFSYHREAVADTVRQLNPDYFLGQTRREYLEASFVGTRNERNTFAYPLTGRFMQVALSYRYYLGGALPAAASVRLRYARYFSLGSGFYYSLGLWAQTRLLADRLGYADARALGYEALVRGYDAYVVEGRHYGLAQQGLTYRLWAPPPLRLSGLRNPKINTLPLAVYLNTFADAGLAAGALGRAEPPSNRLPGRLLASAGVGLHFVTYYDRVFVLELSRNGRGETGFFLRSSFPI